jgi:hypothetical protein
MSGKHTSRNPGGVTKSKLISLRLQPQERAQAERVAAKKGLTRSALARQAFLKGLPLIESEAA